MATVPSLPFTGAQLHTALGDINTELAGKASASHAHTVSAITDINTGDNLLMSAAQAAKLAGIEAGADVTDATNVAAAGALMAANNLADLGAASTARTNLGLGSGDNLLMTAAERSKLAAVEAGATADQSAHEIRGGVRTVTADTSAADTDNNGWIMVNGDHTVTLPAGLTVGTAVAIVAYSASPTVTIAAGSGATVNRRADQALTIGTQWAQVVATVIAADTWLVSGGLDAS